MLLALREFWDYHCECLMLQARSDTSSSSSSCQIAPEIMPEFLAPLENHTVIQGREVSFTCVVNHLQSYRVAWIKSDSRAILAIHTHLVAHNPRLSVTHNGHNTWKLHVSNVQKNDSGTYMCQVNTEPMLSQMGYMTVVIPPDIMDETSEGLVAHEGGNIKLRCVATGSPEPNVTWKREDGHKIVLRENGQKKLLEKYEGEQLELTGVLRQEMGTYLCIASNGIPPTVSKRYAVNVQCEKLLPNDKYSMSEAPINHYSWEMNLTIRSLDKGDFVGYVCSSENALGKAEGAVRLQVSATAAPRRWTAAGAAAARTAISAWAAARARAISSSSSIATTTSRDRRALLKRAIRPSACYIYKMITRKVHMVVCMEPVRG
ncbi:unnamed protein product [Trichogramma brassicae]|uniref:Ig-like domain-containing protein n=1 Tax=Trichogramma brassicae TaxID=86971 RepID=A0A6H5ISR5_9HYME|nr:unnamed protein product [Trichogramma brassicae]